MVDHMRGPETGNNVTTVDLYSDGGAALTNLSDGQVLPAGFRITSTGYSSTGGTMGEPDPGTPAYLMFKGFVDFYNSFTGQNTLLLYGPVSGYTPAVYTLTFTNLDASKRYRFTASTTRGMYATRWTECVVHGANSFIEAHTSGCLTNGDPRVPANTITNGQVAFNSGDNRVGDLVDWQQIDPGLDGEFEIVMRQWVGAIPGGGTAGDNYGYGFSGMRLEEITVDGPPAIIQALRDQTNVVGRTVTFSISALGTQPITYYWYSNDVLAAVNATGHFHQRAIAEREQLSVHSRSQQRIGYRNQQRRGLGGLGNADRDAGLPNQQPFRKFTGHSERARERGKRPLRVCDRGGLFHDERRVVCIGFQQSLQQHDPTGFAENVWRVCGGDQ